MQDPDACSITERLEGLGPVGRWDRVEYNARGNPHEIPA